MNKYIFFFFCLLFFLCNAAEENYIFHKLNTINDKWRQANLMPEMAMILHYPPNSYSKNNLNINISEEWNKNNFSNVVNLLSTDDKCSEDITHLVFNINSSWAIQMLDSDGKLNSGMLQGGLIWPGHFSECQDVYAPLAKDGHGNFRGQYCSTTWIMNLNEEYKNLPLTVGLCVPDSCSKEGIKTALINVTHIIERFPLFKKHSNLLTLQDVSCKLNEKILDAPSIVFIIFVSIIVSFVVWGSGISISDYWKRKKIHRSNNGILSPDLKESENTRKRSRTLSINNTSEATFPVESSLKNKVADSNNSSLIANVEVEIQVTQLPPEKQESVVKQIFLCFSVFINGGKVLNTDVTTEQLSSIHGIRFLSLTWVILGHTYISSVNIIGNKLDVLKQIDSLSFQMLLQSPFSVDSFFLLSGLLLSYLFLKEISRKNGKVNWLYFYFHRLWRLTPSYMVVVFFYMFVFKYFGSGPFWDDHYCEAYSSSWWKYLLYINNFIPIHQMCLGWSWYLANDMQFYVMSPLLLYPLWRWPVIGYSLLASVLILTYTITSVLSYTYDVIPMFVGLSQTKDFASYQERMWNSFDLIYDKPYCRIAPYIIGIILGYSLYRLNQRKNFLTRRQQMYGWTIALFCSLSVVFGLYHVEMSKTTALFYNTLCRSSFSIGLAWLIFVCETGHGGFIAKLLSWKFWIPLSRLTYCAYLVHPILIHGYYQAYQTALFFTEFVMVTNFLGFLVISYAMAFIFSLMFESPMMNLEKLLIKRTAKVT